MHNPVTVAARPRVSPRLGDYNSHPRILLICALALAVGGVAALVAEALLMLIGLITNLVFYQRVAFSLVAPDGGQLTWWLVITAPVVGGLVIGLIARYGSEAIRGHGMPEAIEAILRGGSKIKPRVAILKPVSAAISIGTGGPFGAEGPIIMTGGAFGSLLAQTLSLTADERKTLLVAGAAAGMAATFNAPLASILLAVELLLFEMRPRSFVPVTLAVIVATAIRWRLLGFEPIFPTHYTLPVLDYHILLLCVAVGGIGGFVAWFATLIVYFSEDMFRKLPIHWMWWPAIGGLIIGIGGLFEPRALGVGYDVIQALLQGQATLSLIVGILVVKTLIWSISLGSGTSGGVLAPVFMIGAALGALLGLLFPPVAPGFWALMSLAAVVGGVMRSPLTGIVFAMELTHQWDTLLPLAAASTAAFLLSTLVLKRSILTEKVVRKGTHVTREYSVDPLEVLLVGEVMPRNFVSFRAGTTLQDAARKAAGAWAGDGKRKLEHGQRLYPVLDSDDHLIGLITRHQLLDAALELTETPDIRLDDVMIREMVLGHPDMTLRELANLMAERKIANLPIVAPNEPRQVLSVMTIEHLLQARLIDLDEERKTERVLNLPLIRAVRDGMLVMRRRRG
jgi:H+/Cl- antiporter ClcA/predicted transcriptional regulator